MTVEVSERFVEAVNRIGELQAERDEIRRERDGFEGMLAPKVCSYGGDDTEYFDRVVANHPLPWTGSIDGMIKDSAGGGFAIFCSEFMRLFLPAINSIVSLRAERDSLQSKVEELEAMCKRWETEVVELGGSLREQRRFEAACAFGASHYARGMFSADPDAIATFAVKYADALLAELAKPVGEVET